MKTWPKLLSKMDQSELKDALFNEFMKLENQSTHYRLGNIVEHIKRYTEATNEPSEPWDIDYSEFKDQELILEALEDNSLSDYLFSISSVCPKCASRVIGDHHKCPERDWKED